MQLIDAAAATALFDDDYAALVEHFYQAHRTLPAPAPGEDLLLSEGDAKLLIRPAWRAGDALGVKLATVFPTNPAAGKPSVQALYALFDGRDGAPRAVIAGAPLTWFKTAADSALGSRLLARADCRTLLMVGAGALAPELIKAHRAVRPSLDRILIWNRTPARAAALAASLALSSATLAAVDDLAAAAAEADLISCATMAETPLIKGAWLRPGSHLDLVGAYTPAMREADDAALRGARVAVDSRATTFDATGEIRLPLAAGAIRADAIAELAELCSGRARGRRDAAERTVYKNGGGGHLDLLAAQFLLQRLERRQQKQPETDCG